MPRTRLEMLPAGHAPWLGDPDRVATMVSNFVIERVVRGGGDHAMNTVWSSARRRVDGIRNPVVIVVRVAGVA